MRHHPHQMNLNLKIAAFAASLAVSVASGQGSLNFRGLDQIQFNTVGDTFQLNPGTGSRAAPQFTFTGADSGLSGWIAGAPWAVNLASLSSASGGGLGYQQAAVAGGGQLNVFDGANTLTGNLAWHEIHLLSNGQGGLADSLVVNLTGLSYVGGNADLQALATAGSANLNLTFQFSGMAPTLPAIFNGNAATSFSGAISAAPEPSTAAVLLMTMLVGTVFFWRKRCPHAETAATSH